MCEPKYFDVTYAINPWMKPGTVDKRRAKRQWRILVQILKKLCIHVSTIDQESGSPDMVFSADQGIMLGNTFIVSNFRYPERRQERPRYIEWFMRHRYEIKYLPGDTYYEGSGDSNAFNNSLFVGIGFRTNRAAMFYLKKFCRLSIEPLELIHDHFYHLDTCFFILDQRTAFYYPQALSQKSINRLHCYFPQLIPLTDKEAYGFAANSVVTDHHVLLQKGNTTFVNRLKAMGYTPIEVDVGEFLKAGGGIHCLMQCISEQCY